MITKVCLLAVLLAVSVQCYGGGGGGYGGGRIISPAVISNQRVSFRDVPSRSNAQPISVLIDSALSPINLVFHSSPSPLNIEQRHTPGEGSFRQTSSEDPPHRLVHTITKPIIQEVNEIIQPMRIVRQQIMPVQEEVQALISRAQRAGGFGGQGAGGRGRGFPGPAPPRAYQAFGGLKEDDERAGSDDYFDSAGSRGDFGSAGGLSV